jgi:NAD+ kinase
MSEDVETLASRRQPETTVSCLGLVVHPSRPIERPLTELREWAARNAVNLVQIPASCQQQRVAEPGEPDACELLVSIGGDGTTLAALRAGATAARPVLAVACGSLGVLTTVAGHGLVDALEGFISGDWVPRSLPALDVVRDTGSDVFALNDIAFIRDGAGQVRVTAEADGGVFSRTAGDGCVVSTPVGSSAYALAAGGPLLAPGLDAFVLTPLPTHGGSVPPLVVSARSVIRLHVTTGMGGARLELDGQVRDSVSGSLSISFRRGAATLVTRPDQPPLLSVLRERQIIADSPRFLAEAADE